MRPSIFERVRLRSEAEACVILNFIRHSSSLLSQHIKDIQLHDSEYARDIIMSAKTQFPMLIISSYKPSPFKIYVPTYRSDPCLSASSHHPMPLRLPVHRAVAFVWSLITTGRPAAQPVATEACALRAPVAALRSGEAGAGRRRNMRPTVSESQNSRQTVRYSPCHGTFG